MSRPYGLWTSNGLNPDMNAMLDVARGGVFTVMHDAHGAEQARIIKGKYPDAEILVRHHCWNWNELDPKVWATEVAKRMQDYRFITRRVVFANEQNLEPNADFSRSRYVNVGKWVGETATWLRSIDPGLVIHFPAWAAGHSEDQDDLGFVGYLLPEVLDAVKACDVLDVHCYWDPNEGPLREMGGYGGGLRYRKVQRLLKGAGIDKPIWIDEAGPWAQPWRVEQTIAHSEAVWQDNLLGVTYFLWADPTNNPGNVINQWYGQVSQDKLRWLRDQWNELAKRPRKEKPVPEKPESEWLVQNTVDVVNSLPVNTTVTPYAKQELSDITRIVIHHSAVGGMVTPQAIAEYHTKNRQWAGIGYTFYITADGKIYQTNYLSTISYHAHNWNMGSVGICFAGDFTQTKPTDSQLQAGRGLLVELIRLLKLGATAVIGHGSLPDNSTACPAGDWWKVMLEKPPAPQVDIQAAIGALDSALADLHKASVEVTRARSILMGNKP